MKGSTYREGCAFDGRMTMKARLTARQIWYSFFMKLLEELFR
jgi:hypothetical protein